MDSTVKAKIAGPNGHLNGTRSAGETETFFDTSSSVSTEGHIGNLDKFVTSETGSKSHTEYALSKGRSNQNGTGIESANKHGPGSRSASLQDHETESISLNAAGRESISLHASQKDNKNSPDISNRPEHFQELIPGPSGDHAGSSSEDIIPNLLDGLAESFRQKPFDWNDLVRIYKASKYNKKAIRRISSGEIKKGFDLWERSSKLGNTDAMFNIALCHEEGKVVEQNYTKASIHYAKAAEKDHAEAAYNLALMYLNGQTGETGINCEQTNLKEASKLLEKAKDLGHIKAATELGVIHTQEGSMTEAKECFEIAASGCGDVCEKDAVACLLLAHIHSESNSPETEDLYKQAVTLLEQQKQEPSVKFFLGQCYEHGWGVTKDEREAAMLYRSSDHKEAATRLKNVDSHEDLSDDFQCSESEETGSSSSSIDLVEFRPTIPNVGSEKPKKIKRKSVSKRKRSHDQQVPGEESSDDGISFEDPQQNSMDIQENQDSKNSQTKVKSKAIQQVVDGSAGKFLGGGSLFLDDKSMFTGSEPPDKRFMLYRLMSTDGSTSTSTSDSVPSFGSDT